MNCTSRCVNADSDSDAETPESCIDASDDEDSTIEFSDSSAIHTMITRSLVINGNYCNSLANYANKVYQENSVSLL